MDPAVDAVLTAETINGQLAALKPRLRSLAPVDVSEAVGQAQALYPELWSALDRARGVLRDRGVDVPAYDEARARQPAAMLGVNVQLRESGTVAQVAATAAFLVGGVAGVVVATAIDVVDGLGQKKGGINRGGLDDATIALDALRTAMPEVDWVSVRRHETRAAAIAGMQLSAGKGKKVLLTLVGIGILGGLAFGIATLLESNRAPTKLETAQKEQEEYSAARDELRELNDTLRGNPCELPAAERRVKLLFDHDQQKQAQKVAKKFLAECGDHAYMKSVAGP